MTKQIVKHNQMDFIDEKSVNDIIFSSNEFDSRVTLEHDVEFNNPSVRTWFYTNIENRDVWVNDMSPLPILVPVNKNIMIKLKLFRKVVVIVKTYDFKFKNKNKYELIIKNILLDNVVNEADKQKFIDSLLMLRDREIPFGNKERIRLVYVIEEDELTNNKAVSIDNFLISLDVPEVIDDNVSSTVSPSNETLEPTMSLRADIDFVCYSGKDITVDLFGKPLSFKCDDSKNLLKDYEEEDSLTITLKTSRDKSYHGSFKRKDLRKMGVLLNETEEEKCSKNKHNLERDLKIIESMDKRFDNNLTVIKFLHEHNVSIHKLFSYIIREEAAILALEKDKLGIEKEEISTAKEFLKLIGSMK